MASSKKNNDKEPEVFDVEEPVEPKVEPKAKEVAITTSQPKAVSKKPRGLTFTQWASLRGFRPQHLGGMRAFLKNPSQLRSAEDWDKVFETY